MNRHIDLALRGLSRAAVGAGLALAALVGCGGSEPGGGAGGGTTSSVTTSSTTTGSTSSATTGSTTTSSSSTTSSMGTGGAPPDPPVFDVAKVGSPLWEPVDFHQFSANVGNMFENFGTINAGLLPPPKHENHPDLGVGPGDAHAGPYDTELAAGVLAGGYVERATFPKVDGMLPNAIMTVWMVVPSTGAPTGSSPDFASGPIIPNTKFPIHVAIDVYSDNVVLDGYSFAFDVPALNSMLAPPFNVDGHSHFPLFNAGAFDGLPTIPGTLETRVKLRDRKGDGWDVTMKANAAP